MDRIIEVKINGTYLWKDSNYAGTKGEANVTKLRITFDEGWDGYAKEITFWDALGENPVGIVLTSDLLENIAESIRVYLVPIPAEPMAVTGMMSFVVDGKVVGKNQRSVSAELQVKEAPTSPMPVEPTPTQLQQIQAQFETVLKTIHEGYEVDIENMDVSAETLPAGEEATVRKFVQDGKSTLRFGLPRGENGKTGSSGVYIGDEEPTDPQINVWINPNGDDYYVNNGVAIISDSDTEEIVEKIAMLTASGWQGEAAPYVQEITVVGMKAETQGTVAVSENATDEQYTAAAYASLRKVAQGTNSLTIKAYGEKPSVDIPLTVRMVG